MKIWLDDYREAPKGWLHVKTFSQFVEALHCYGKDVEFISYDHDLADFHYVETEEGLDFDYDSYTCEEKTGYHCAVAAFEYYKGYHPEWDCHSMNPTGKKNIENLLKEVPRLERK